MGKRAAIVGAVAVVVAGTVVAAQALVLCQKKSGALFVRTACKKKETSVDPASFGVTGARGPGGPTGPQGPIGPAGMAIKLDFRVPASTASMSIFDSGKLQISADCNSGGMLGMTATTTVDHATLHSYGNGSDFSTNDFLIATPLALTPSSDEERDLVYSEPGGQIVIIQYQASQASPLGGTITCLVSGLAFVE
jgi:hypothetical protein